MDKIFDDADQMPVNGHPSRQVKSTPSGEYRGKRIRIGRIETARKWPTDKLSL